MAKASAPSPSPSPSPSLNPQSNNLFQMMAQFAPPLLGGGSILPSTSPVTQSRGDLLLDLDLGSSLSQLDPAFLNAWAFAVGRNPDGGVREAFAQKFRRAVSPTTAVTNAEGQQQNIALLRNPAAHRGTQGGTGDNRMTNNFSPTAPSTKGNARPGSDSGPATVRTAPARPRRPRSSRSSKSLRRVFTSSLQAQSRSGRRSSIISRQ